MRRHGYKSSLLNLPLAACVASGKLLHPPNPFSLLIRLAQQRSEMRLEKKTIKPTEHDCILLRQCYCYYYCVCISENEQGKELWTTLKALLGCLLNATEVGTPASTHRGSQSGSQGTPRLAGSSPRPRPLSHSPAPPCHIPLFLWGGGCDSHGL